MNPNWRPKIEHWRSAIEGYLDLWDMSGADIDTVLMRCQVDPVLRGEYLRLEASLGGAGWHRLMTECRLVLWDGDD